MREWGAGELIAGTAVPPLTVVCDVATLNEIASTLPRDPRGVPMTGCAGGLSGALWAAHNAELVSGADYVLDLLGFGRLSHGRGPVRGDRRPVDARRDGRRGDRPRRRAQGPHPGRTARSRPRRRQSPLLDG